MKELNSPPKPPQDLKTWFEAEGYDHFGFAALEKPLTLGLYEAWLNQGHHGEMSYLERHLPDKQNPERLLEKARSAIVIAYAYRPKHPKPAELPTPSLRIASYSRGEDYHRWIQTDLQQLIEKLKEKYPGESFLSATDSSPVLERDLAYRAGLGWFGKNTCTIDQKRGSFFLIGEILTTISLTSFSPIHADRCGTCTRCIDACPTNAFESPRVLNARKCISYLTIESKKAPPPELAEKMGDHFFGCDICQSVCPWNEKILKPELQPEQKTSLDLTAEAENKLIEELKYILSSSNKQIEKAFQHSPMARARGFGLKRNAIVVSANRGLTELVPEIQKLLEEPRLELLVKWALDKIERTT